MLDRAIMLLEPAALRDPAARKSLVSAYEMRARARFGTGNRDGAVSDFRAVLALNPSFTLGEGVSPRVVALLDEVKSATVGILELQTTPGDVSVQVDGVAVPSSGGKVSVATGAHSIKITRPGYKSAEQPVIVTAGQVVPLQSTLERVSTVLTVVSSPPDVEVFVNGVSRGKTGSGPVPASLAGVPAQLGVPASLVSQPLVIGDIPAGTLQVELRRPCYATEHRQLPVEGMSDVMLDPVKLAPAMGTLEVDSEPGRGDRVDRRGAEGARADHDGVGLRGHADDRVPRRVGPRRRARDTRRGREDVGEGPRAAGFRAARGARDGQHARSPARRRARVRLVHQRGALRAAGGCDEGGRGQGAGERRVVRPRARPGSVGPAAERRSRTDNLTTAFESQGIAWVKPSRPGSTEMQIALAVPGALQPDAADRGARPVRQRADGDQPARYAAGALEVPLGRL